MISGTPHVAPPAAVVDSAVITRGLTKQYRGMPVPALRDVSLSVASGEVVGLLGANGAGKTSLLRILAGVLRPTKGTATVAGLDTVRDATAVHGAVGALFGGATGLYERLSARENIHYFAALNGVSRAEIPRRIEEMVELFGMQEFADRMVSGFSSGMKQRTALARAMVHRPRALILDEPTTGLDIAAAIVVQEFVLRCREEGRSVLISSHNTGELERVCDRVIIVRSGGIVFETRPGVDIAPGELRELYLRVSEEGV
ncbi:MAG: ATP-binding cassette domain-containing protein [Alkalispirochaeta sp.]